MKFKWTLKKELALFLVLQVMILVAVYSYLLPFYLWNGAQQAASVFMETQAKQIAAQLERGVDVTDNGQDRGIEAYIGFAALPEEIAKFYTDLQPLRDKRVYTRGYLEEDGEEISILLMPYDLAGGQQLIIVFRVRESVLERQGGAFDQLNEYLELTRNVGAGFLILWGLATLFLLHRIAQRTRRMSKWTRELAPGDHLTQPSFGYGEFNEVGTQLKESIDSITAALARESEFVRNASHELRTPISVIRTNLDLIQVQSQGVSEPHERIKRAALKMQRIVDALLWLSRDDDKLLAPIQVDLGAVVHRLVEDHRNLLRENAIEIADQRSQPKQLLADQALDIALANLIRNAFEHTAKGTVAITIREREVAIENRVSGTQDAEPTDGLGLTLVRKIADRMGWHYSHESNASGYAARLRFDDGLTRVA
ncbi:MAG: HAMP domain-containing sensor histidine kinase [Pseudomonadota bacterium]